MSLRSLLLSVVIVAFAAASLVAQEPAKKLKVGLIGLDTRTWSRSPDRCKIRNGTSSSPSRSSRLFRAVAPTSSRATPRREGFTKQLKEMGVEIVDSIDSVCRR